MTSIPSLSSWYLISIELRVLAAAAYGRGGGKGVREKKEEGRKGTGREGEKIKQGEERWKATGREKGEIKETGKELKEEDKEGEKGG